MTVIVYFKDGDKVKYVNIQHVFAGSGMLRIRENPEVEAVLDLNEVLSYEIEG